MQFVWEYTARAHAFGGLPATSPARYKSEKWTDPKDVKIIRNAYLLLYIIIILCGTARATRTSVIKDSISKWNHFFIELSSCTDINYGARTLPQLARVSLFVLPFGMLYKSILFSNYMRRWTGNFNVNFAIIQCSDEINSRYRYTNTSGRWVAHLSSVMTWKRSLALTITNRCRPIKYGTRK